MRHALLIILTLTVSLVAPAHLALACGGGGGGGNGGPGEVDPGVSATTGDPSQPPAGIIITEAPPIEPINVGPSDPTIDPMRVTSPEPGNIIVVEGKPTESEGDPNDPYVIWRNQPPSMGPLQGGGPLQGSPVQINVSGFGPLVPGLIRPPEKPSEHYVNTARAVITHSANTGVAALGSVVVGGPPGVAIVVTWGVGSTLASGGTPTEAGVAAAVNVATFNVHPVIGEGVSTVVSPGITWVINTGGDIIGPMADPTGSPASYGAGPAQLPLHQ